MDDEQSFAALLRSTTPASRPTWDAPAASGAVGGGASGLGGAGGMSADPWANPFASSPPQPFAAPSIPRLPAVPDLPSPSFGSMSMNSPYDAYTAGATQNSLGGQGGFGDDGTGVVDDAVAAFGGMSMARPSAASRIHVEDQKESPYVQQLEAEGVTGQTMSSGTQGEAFGAQVDPPSVIAAREQEALDAQHAFEHDQSAIAPSPEPTMEDDPFAQPFASPSRAFTSPIRPVSPPIPPFTLPSDSPPARATTQSSPIAPTPTATAPTAASPSKKLPAGLIDDDLLAASDPMLSLKKAFVKSTPAVSAADTAEGAAKGSKEADKGRSSPAPKARHVDRAKKTFVFSAGASKKPAEVKKTQPPSQTKSQPSQPHSLESKSAKEEDKAGVSVNGDQSGQEDAGAAATESDQTAETKHDARKTGDVPADDKGTDEGSAHGSKPAAVAPPEGKEQERKQPAVQPSLEPQTAESTDKTENAEPDASPTVPLGEKSQPASVKAAPSGAAHEEKPSTESLQTVLNGRTEAAEPVTEPNAAEPTSADNALSTSEKRRSLRPAAIPLPDSTLTSPGLSRQVSHVPDNTAATTTSQAETGPTPTIEASSSSPSRIITSPQPPSSLPDGSASAPTVQTPYDRVAVSPLDGPVRQASDFGFTPAPADTSVNYQRDDMVRDAAGGWDESPLSGTTPQGRFSAKGWGAVDDLFGRKDDPWGGDEDAQGDWQEAGPSTPAESEYREPAPAPAEAEPESAYLPESSTATPISARQSPVKPRRKTHPVFTIAIGDPTRVGDPVRGYTVYTIRTHTTSPHYRKSDLSALRRFSDFLWLVEALTANNPGIIIPPVPDKHTFGRFQEQFIETRRMALERSLTKITAHPVLQLDPDLRSFLESDNFALESKARRPALDTAPEQRGLLSGWTGPRFVESDDWFVSRGAFLDSLEAQLRGLSKAVEVSSKARLDYAIALGESAETMSRLAESDLGSAMCAALARLADLGRTEKEAAEELAKGDVVNLLNVADEYIRFIGSVRIAMQARTKGWFAWQSHVKEANRFKATREKMRAQGKLGDRAAQSLAEANELDRRAADAERDYETTSKVIKSEFARFERERVEEFKRALERWLDVQITRQKEVIEAWEEYHGVVLKMVHKAQGTRVPQPQH